MMPKLCSTIGLAAATLITTSVVAQAENNAIADDTAWVAVVTKQATPLRCGANESYYPVAIADKDAMVRVIGKRQDWLKVETDGIVFANTIGYIKYPANNADLFAISDTTGTALGEVEVLGNNIESEELYRSWRPVFQLHDGDTVEVTGSTTTEPGTLHRESYVVHTVKIPAKATAWIHHSAATKATPTQAAAWGTQTVGETLAGTTDQENTSSVVTTAPTTENPEGDSSTTTTETDGESTIEIANTYTPLSLAELEMKWKTMSTEPVMGAEVSPLLDMYTELLNAKTGDLVVERIANGRIKQLNVWNGLQEQRVRITALRNRLDENSQDVSKYQDVISTFDGYALTGKLAYSNTFDGRLRPFMYRIQDPKSGRTLGYLPENEEWELNALVGQVIGVKGKAGWDPHWRVNMVEGTSLDLVSPTTATVSPDIQ